MAELDQGRRRFDSSDPLFRTLHAAPGIGFCILLAVLAPSAQAQIEAHNESVLPGVVVTATRDAQPVFNIPAAIDVVRLDNSDNDRLGVNLSEVLGLVPGLLVRNRQNYAQDEQISIRGFGARSTFGVRGVRIYTDGIPASMPDGSGQVSHVNLDSADRIEVLRGPFSALYGNAAGGVIQSFTANGTDPPEIRATLVGASYATERASINARGIGGPLDYNLDITHFRTNGYREHSAAARDSGNARLLWDTGVGGSLSVLANTVSIPQAQDPLGLTFEQFEQDPRQASAVAELFNTRKSVQQSQAGTVWTQEFGERQSVRVLAYAGRRDVEQFLAIPVGAQGNPLHSGGVIDLDSDYSGSDARWTWASESFETTIGASYDSQDLLRRGYTNFVGSELGVRGDLRRDESDRVHNFDQYAQLRWDFAPAWSLTTGVRHSEIAFRVDDAYVTAGNPDDSGQRDYAATTPVVGLLYRAAPSAHLYASWGRGFETPTFAELGYRSDGGAGLNFELNPAHSRSAELGAKLRLGGSVESNLAVFRADTNDEIAVATNSAGRSTFRNVGSARRQGAEASLLARFGDQWTLQFAGTWLDATFQTPFLACSGIPCSTPSIPVAAGTQIPGVPRTHLVAALDWGDDLGPRLGMQVEHLGAVPVDDIGTQPAPAYSVLGLNAGYGFKLSSGQLRAFLNVGNVFDRNFVGSVIVNDGNGRYYEPAQGFNVAIGLQWLWAAH